MRSPRLGRETAEDGEARCGDAMHEADLEGPVPGPGAREPSRTTAAAMWGSLLPLMLLLHPYRGLVQDARIYVGRGVADLDPAGVGRDIMFANDGQTGFTLMRGLVDASLGLFTPGVASLLLALVGILLLSVSLAALARTLASGRTAWATAVCTLALPTQYGAYGVFNYAEPVATPRVFAEAAVLGGLAALSSGRRAPALALLVIAAAFHPLIALPGLAIAAVLLVLDDRRWLVPIAAAVMLLTVAAATGAPVAGRLFETFDAAWLTTLRRRSDYLFPSLWPAETFVPIAGQAVAVIVAATLAPPRTRRLLLATCGVAASGVTASWIFGDLHPSILVTQLQTWRALWPLAVLGNASLGLAAAGLWRRGRAGRITLAFLALTWLTAETPLLSFTLCIVTVGLQAAILRRVFPAVSRAVAVTMALAVATLALVDIGKDSAAIAVLLRAARDQGGEVVWPMIASIGLQTVPLVAVAVALAVGRRSPRRRPVRAAAAASLLVGVLAAAWLWDGRTGSRRSIERSGGDPALRQALAPVPGDLLWIDEESETWLIAGRSAYLNAAQAGPILFSRDLALEWAGRADLLLGLGLAHPDVLKAWGSHKAPTPDPAPSRGAIEVFCGDRRRPAALIGPGDWREAAPPGWWVWLWRPAVPIQGVSVDDDGLRWRVTAEFTVLRCPAGPGG